MAGYFEVKQNGLEEYSFNLKSANHKVILSSQIYDTHQRADDQQRVESNA